MQYQTAAEISVQDRLSGKTFSAGATLTLIDTQTRRLIFVESFSDRIQALERWRALGGGYDAHIRTTEREELFLSL
jgi:hypothetical protein